jgi:class 3 adenylate cyclase/tetratricopeptide (TPR) repeat protein
MTDQWRRPPDRPDEADGLDLDALEGSAQRRQMTVLFCDMVGSTRLSSRMDPEDVHDLLAAFLGACARQVEAWGGFPARYLGDGLLAYFGYPVVREDDAMRAVRSALAMRAAVADLARSRGQPIAVRIGVATGLVVVGDMVGQGMSDEQAVVGETPNLAARLQAIAGEGGVVISDTTRSLVEGLFELDDHGARRLKGFAGRRRSWKVIAERPAAGLARRRALALTPLTGRGEEMAWLIGRRRAAAMGQGHSILIAGEPGIGKSRLVQELRAAGGALWLQGGAAEILHNSPFHPVIALGRQALDGRRTRSPSTRRRLLRRWLQRVGVGDEQSIGLVTGLILGEESPSAGLLGPDDRRKALMGALSRALVNASARRPVIAVVEDLHWADPSTMELLRIVDKASAGARLLLVCTSREVAALGWRPPPERTLLLQRLDGASLEALVRTAGGGLTEEAVSRAVARADGVPLFAEELARVLQGGGPAEETPSTLSDLLLAQLDALGRARPVAQVAAVLGEPVSLSVLAACCGGAARDVPREVERLVEAGILAPREGDERRYVFRHGLIRDAAYQALLKSQRRALHRRVTSVLTRSFPELVAAQPDVIAQHWTGAGDLCAALGAWHEAARLAERRRAYGEAQRACDKALELLEALGPFEGREDAELELHALLAIALRITRGYSAPETVAATRQAQRIAEAHGDPKQQFSQASGAWMAASSAGEYARAGRLAEQLLSLARAEGGLASLGTALMMALTSRYRVGDFLGAEDAFEQGAASFRSEEFLRHPGVAPQTFGNAAVNAWILGETAEAERRADLMLELSAANGNAYDRAFANYMAAILSVLTGDFALGESRADVGLQVSEELGFPQFVATSRIVLGRALAGLGRAVEGVRMIEAGLGEMEAKTRSRAAMTMYLNWLGEAQAAAGEAQAALASFDRALTENPQERFFRPETFRLRGLVQASLGQMEAARQDLEAAWAMAQRLQARCYLGRAIEALQALKAVKAS